MPELTSAGQAEEPLDSDTAKAEAAAIMSEVIAEIGDVHGPGTSVDDIVRRHPRAQDPLVAAQLELLIASTRNPDPAFDEQLAAATSPLP